MPPYVPLEDLITKRNSTIELPIVPTLVTERLNDRYASTRHHLTSPDEFMDVLHRDRSKILAGKTIQGSNITILPIFFFCEGRCIAVKFSKAVKNPFVESSIIGSLNTPMAVLGDKSLIASVVITTLANEDLRKAFTLSEFAYVPFQDKDGIVKVTSYKNKYFKPSYKHSHAIMESTMSVTINGSLTPIEDLVVQPLAYKTDAANLFPLYYHARSIPNKSHPYDSFNPQDIVDFLYLLEDATETYIDGTKTFTKLVATMPSLSDPVPGWVDLRYFKPKLRVNPSWIASCILYRALYLDQAEYLNLLNEILSGKYLNSLKEQFYLTVAMVDGEIGIDYVTHNGLPTINRHRPSTGTLKNKLEYILSKATLSQLTLLVETYLLEEVNVLMEPLTEFEVTFDPLKDSFISTLTSVYTHDELPCDYKPQWIPSDYLDLVYPYCLAIEAFEKDIRKVNPNLFTAFRSRHIACPYVEHIWDTPIVLHKATVAFILEDNRYADPQVKMKALFKCSVTDTVCEKEINIVQNRIYYESPNSLKYVIFQIKPNSPLDDIIGIRIYTGVHSGQMFKIGNLGINVDYDPSLSDLEKGCCCDCDCKCHKCCCSKGP